MYNKRSALTQIKIDTLVNMIKMSYTFEDWNEVISLSEGLLELAQLTKNREKQFPCLDSMEKPPLYYFGYSYLIKGLALQKLRAYSESRECINRYADLSWVEDSSEENPYYIDRFKDFAKANSLTIDVLSGNKERLPEYLDVLTDNSDEIIPGLITIIESALTHNYNVDAEIEKLTPYISKYKHQNSPVRISYYLTVHYLLALYHYKNQRYTAAIDYALHNLTISDKLNHDKFFKKTVALFEFLKTHATNVQTAKYSHILIAWCSK